MLGAVVLCSCAMSLFVSVEQAAALLREGAAVLDARGSQVAFVKGHLPGAAVLDWMDLRDGWGRTGRLDGDPERLSRKLSALGVDGERPVLVYGAAHKGFGEEGRIAWTLSYLGHPRVRILDGGLGAWQESGRPLERGFGKRRSGHFVAAVQDGLRADKERVKSISQAKAATPDAAPILLDVRTPEEYGGATPYFEARGGHIPGARHLDWQKLFESTGKLRSPDELRRLFAGVGIAPAESAPEVVVYCTGGVRSAFVWAALRTLGVPKVRNYDGSFWEWAADKSLPAER